MGRALGIATAEPGDPQIVVTHPTIRRQVNCGLEIEIAHENWCMAGKPGSEASKAPGEGFVAITVLKVGRSLARGNLLRLSASAQRTKCGQHESRESRPSVQSTTKVRFTIAGVRLGSPGHR